MVTTETLEVADMSCTGCADRLTTALSRAEGVIKVEADHRIGQVQVRYDPGRISHDQVKERIRTAGYEVA